MDGAASAEEPSDTYFSSYEDLSVHELMLKDRPRTEAYQRFMIEHADAIRGKVVLHVGAGTGILSLLAAKAGASKVYAVEASGLAKLCQQIVDVNGYSDVIDVIQARIEDATLPVKQVDVIVSEWMGFYLLHEAMLGSVLFARDKWLSPTGLLIPSSATLYMCPVNLKTYVKDNLQFWDNAYGFNFSPLKAVLELKHRTQPSIQTLEPGQCLAEAQRVVHLELQFLDAEQLERISERLRFTITKHGVCHGFACWFSCTFELNPALHKSTRAHSGGDSVTSQSVVLDTSPHAPVTHWQQTVVLLPDALMLSKQDELACALALQRDAANPRLYNIAIEVDEEEEEGEEGEEGKNEGNAESMEENDLGSGNVSEMADLIAKAMEK